MKKPTIWPIILIGIALIVCIPGAFLFGYLNNLEYQKNGTEVECTVFAYEKVGRSSELQVKYYDENGNRYEAYVKNGGVNPYIGQEFTGYVLPDDPYEVYRKEDLFVIILAFMLCGVCIIGGVYLIFGTIAERNTSERLRKDGIRGECEIFEVTMEKIAKGRLVYPAKFRYIDDNGDEQRGKHIFERRPPELGDKFDIVYARKSNGKYISMLIE